MPLEAGVVNPCAGDSRLPAQVAGRQARASVVEEDTPVGPAGIRREPAHVLAVSRDDEVDARLELGHQAAGDELAWCALSLVACPAGELRRGPSTGGRR